MSDHMEAELADLAFDEAEGAAESYDDVEAYDDVDAFGDVDAGDDIDAMDEGDEGDEYDIGEGDIDEGIDLGDEACEEAMAMALGAEDSDEFFRRAFRAIRRAVPGIINTARNVASTVGRVARTAAPICRRRTFRPLPPARNGVRCAGSVRFRTLAPCQVVARYPACAPSVTVRVHPPDGAG